MSIEALVFHNFKKTKEHNPVQDGEQQPPYYEMLFGRLGEAARKYNLRLSRGSINDIHVLVKDSKLSVSESLTGRALDSFDVVYFELWSKTLQQALAAASFLKYQGVPFFTKEVATITPTTKLGEVSVLANQGIPIPDTFSSSRIETKKVFKSDPPFKWPVVAKSITGWGGRTNFLVKNYEELATVLDNNRDDLFIIQPFIPNEHDYRCLIFGGELKLVIKRQRSGDSHLNNTSKGAEGTVVDDAELSESMKKDVLAAATRLGRSEFAGVDLLVDSETGQHYILEVNRTPQIEIGVEVEKKMDQLLAYMAKVSRGAEDE